MFLKVQNYITLILILHILLSKHSLLQNAMSQEMQHQGPVPVENY